MRFLSCLFVFMALASVGECQPPVPAVEVQRKTPSGLEGLVWNKWDTDHFVVISLDKSRGAAMRHEVETVRHEVLNRWSIPESNSSGCKLVLVPDASMLKKLFGLSEPKCEVSGSASGATASIWIDEDRISLLPSLVVECELARGDFKPFVRRGVPILERSPAKVREEILASTGSALASVLGDGKQPVDARDSALVCLLARKEFGAAAFGKVVAGSAPPLHEALGFSSAEELESTYKRYRANLIDDIKSEKTPDEYLGVRR